MMSGLVGIQAYRPILQALIGLVGILAYRLGREVHLSALCLWPGAPIIAHSLCQSPVVATCDWYKRLDTHNKHLTWHFDHEIGVHVQSYVSLWVWKPFSFELVEIFLKIPHFPRVPFSLFLPAWTKTKHHVLFTFPWCNVSHAIWWITDSVLSTIYLFLPSSCLKLFISGNLPSPGD